MLNLFRHSEEADFENILAQHAVRHMATAEGKDSHEKQFRDLLQALPAAIYTTDADGRITFFNRACIEFAGRTPKIGDMWCVTWKLFWPDGTPLAHEDCPMAIALKENRSVRDVEAIAERPDGSRICFMPYPTPLRDEAGRLLGAVNMLVDITTRKQAEERMMLLTGEVDHRSNNLLAVIQAMLRLTRADTAEEFQAAFQGRLSALANVQRLFSVSRWTGASIQKIIEEELRPYGSTRVSLAGSDVRLPAALAQAIAVSVHELATNAAKYGSLSGPAGKIDIRWQVDASDNLLLHWTEIRRTPRRRTGAEGIWRRRHRRHGPHPLAADHAAVEARRAGLRIVLPGDRGVAGTRPQPSLRPSSFSRPANQPDKVVIDHAAGIDLRHRDLLLAERKVHADPVGEPQMRIGQRLQLVLVVFQRLVIAGLADLDREQIVRNLALVHDDIGIDRFAEMIVGRDDRPMRQPQRSLAEPVEIAIDVPARKLLFAMHRQPVRQRALTEILLQQEGFTGIEFLQCA